MFKLEKKFLEWVETHIIVLAVVFLTVISAVIRFSLRQEVSCDAAFYAVLLFLSTQTLNFVFYGYSGDDDYSEYPGNCYGKKHRGCL